LPGLVEIEDYRRYTNTLQHPLKIWFTWRWADWCWGGAMV